MARSALRVFIGVVEIAGIGTGLAKGLKNLGIDASLVLSSPHPFKYGNTPVNSFTRVWMFLGGLRQKTNPHHVFRKIFIVAGHKLCGWLILIHSIRKFDAFVFIYGETLTNTRLELWLLKRFRKRVLVVLCGSDSRPPYMSGASFIGVPEGHLPAAEQVLKATKKIKRKIRRLEEFSDYIVNSPGTAQFHERPYINWFAMGIPKAFPPTDNINFEERKPHGRVKILHCPSNPKIKGTESIIKVIESLKSRGFKIDFLMIEGMPNKAVLTALMNCDFIVDQLYSDTPMATFSTEAAYFSKPTVVGGYFSELLTGQVSIEDIPPSLFVRPEELEAAIERLITDPRFRHQLGRQAKSFITTKWSLNKVAERYVHLLEGNIPDSWWIKPADIQYAKGCGLHVKQTSQLIKLIVDNYGEDALQVSDKQKLKEELLRLATIKRAAEDA